MIKVNLLLAWTANEHCGGQLYKRVEMPCLPSVGTSIWLHDCGSDFEWLDNCVKAIHWWEKYPDRFEVILEASDFGFVDSVNDLLLDLHRMGWLDSDNRFADQKAESANS